MQLLYILWFNVLGVWNEVLLLLQEKNQEEEGGPRQVTASPSRWDHRVHTLQKAGRAKWPPLPLGETIEYTPYRRRAAPSDRLSL
jgi:hypothetical protein